MKLTNENVLMASLLGSNVVEKLPRFETIQNELSKHVLPPINFLPVRSSNANVSEIRNDRDFEIWVEENEISEERCSAMSSTKWINGRWFDDSCLWS